MTVRVDARRSGRAWRAAARAAIVRAVKDGVGVTVAVEVVEPYALLERSVGKIRRVVDERGRVRLGRPEAHGCPEDAVASDVYSNVDA